LGEKRLFSTSFKASTLLGINISRVYSTNIPVAARKYQNADAEKGLILIENRGKSGVYRWTNKVNGKSYVGSSINLVKSFTNYYSFNYISKSKMSISKAMIKYGYSHFTLEILEFCDPSNAILREQHYIDIFKPEYNILKMTGSSLGYTHTEETLAKFKARSLTPEQKANSLVHLKLHNSSPEQREKYRKRILEYNNSKGQRVELLDTISNETTLYTTIRQAAKAIGCVHGTILLADKAFKEKGVSRLVKKIYRVKIVKDEF
jgi:group I intron endonuclease